MFIRWLPLLFLMPDRYYIPLSLSRSCHHARACKGMPTGRKSCPKRRKMVGSLTQQLALHLLRSKSASSWPAVLGWRVQEEPQIPCSWEACACYPCTQKWRSGDIETLFWRRCHWPFANRAISQHLNFSQSQNLKNYWGLPSPDYIICVLVCKNVRARCSSTSDLHEQSWRSQGCSLPSHQLQAAVQERADVCWQEENDELHKQYL